MEIINCRLNYLENPLGYRLTHTAFSWQVEGSRAETARRPTGAAGAALSLRAGPVRSLFGRPPSGG